MVELTNTEVDAALERGRIAKQSEPRAHACRYDVETKRIIVELTNGCVFSFPACLEQGLEYASDEQLAQVKTFGSGYGLHWEALDIDLSIPGLLAGLFGARAYMAQQGGCSSSPAKAKAARANGIKGGRPRKTA